MSKPRFEYTVVDPTGVGHYEVFAHSPLQAARKTFALAFLDWLDTRQPGRAFGQYEVWGKRGRRVFVVGWAEAKRRSCEKPDYVEEDADADLWEDVKAARIPPAFVRTDLGKDPTTAADLRSLLASWRGPVGESWRKAQGIVE